MQVDVKYKKVCSKSSKELRKKLYQRTRKKVRKKLREIRLKMCKRIKNMEKYERKVAWNYAMM